MDPLVSLLLGLFLGVVVGVAMGWLVRSHSAWASGTDDPALVAARHEAELTRVQSHEAERRAQLAELLGRAETRADALQERIDAQREQYQDLVERHRRERDAEADRARTESRVLQALAPVRESLHDMHQKVAELESQRSLQHGELAQQLRSATESEERLRSTAESLAAALTNNSTRGVWGETQLRSVVEAAGLIERVNFDVQSSITSDSGAGRPDMVVYLPGGKSIAVDAKVPFNAYLEASAIPLTAPEPELARRAQLMKEHVKAVRAHITTLGSKTYWEGLDASPEMVIAFIPSESLVSSALEADPTIMEFAFSKRVALSSPVTLWSVLKTVAFSWQQDVVTQEAKTLFDSSRELYSRLATMAGHIDKLGRSVRATVNDYNRFVGSLERQVLPSARKLTVLDDSKAIAPLTEVEDAPRDLTAFELLAELDKAEISREIRDRAAAEPLPAAPDEH
ncbi:DNA recombination protein RmuC [Okibacterium sp. HSC-33S16]|uniref:DNA recombination protein RmuC n=1 Tax=Okibacterium sp. HSC-33S16 TaxID=2910965 RepID=UPI00209F283A|nr:DNA recombination protein RmuC [Okibacterium sp. HSC-33S16]MCP2030335.1 DNA recombination protein RmuC [Okibacterium sp. HSC-33S16]